MTYKVFGGTLSLTQPINQSPKTFDILKFSVRLTVFMLATSRETTTGSSRIFYRRCKFGQRSPHLILDVIRIRFSGGLSSRSALFIVNIFCVYSYSLLFYYSVACPTHVAYMHYVGCIQCTCK